MSRPSTLESSRARRRQFPKCSSSMEWQSPESSCG
jgi:hypothetical protein